MIAAELVAKSAAGPLEVDVLAREHSIYHLRAHRRCATDPPLALFAVALHESVAELLDVVERPVRSKLDRFAQFAWVGDRLARLCRPSAEERCLADVVGTQERVKREATSHELARVVDRRWWRYRHVGRTFRAREVDDQPKDAVSARVRAGAQLGISVHVSELGVDRVGDVLRDGRQPLGVLSKPEDELSHPLLRSHSGSLLRGRVTGDRIQPAGTRLAIDAIAAPRALS